MDETGIKIKLPFFLFLMALLLICSESVPAQNGSSTFKKRAGRPEKWWAVCHPFIVKKAVRLTLETSKAVDSLVKAGTLGNDLSGGQLDAFKHSYWMALLSQQIKSRKARKLGKAHEKANYLSFRKALKQGKKNCHDKPASDMDLWNNEKGIEIGTANKRADRIELQQIVIDSVQAGAMRILLKNNKGQYLDCLNNIIPADSLKGRWKNAKCLVPSNMTGRNIHDKKPAQRRND